MKRVQLILSVLFTAFTTTSQAQVIKSPTVDEYRNMVLKAVRMSAANTTAAKTTGTQQRLKAYANYNVAPVAGIFDTAAFFYSGTNTSVYNRSEMDFMLQEFNPAFEPMVDMSPYMTSPNMIENEYDSTVYFAYDSASSGLQLMTIMSIDYYAPKTPSVVEVTEDPNNGGDHYKMLSVYNASGKLERIHVVADQTGTGTLDTVISRYFYYNAQGKVSHDSSVMAFSGTTFDFMKYEYTYDASGKLTSMRTWNGFTGTWEETSKIELGWNSQGKINTISTLQWDGASYQAVGFDSLGYSAAGDVITYRMTRELDMNMVLADKSYQTIHLNAQGLPDTALMYANIGGTWTLEGKTIMAYNTYGNPTSRKDEFFGAGSPMVSSEKKYYYELFNDGTTGVGGIDKNISVTVYPNPATESIKVRWNGAHDAKAQLQVYSVAGQLVAQQAMQPSGETTVNITSLPAGQYILIIKDNKGVLINRQSFIKM